MRYLPLISLITKAATCMAKEQGKVNVVTLSGVENLEDPSSVCSKLGMQPFLLRAEDVNLVLGSMRSAGVSRAHIAGWNQERISMVIGTESGDVTPRDHNNRTNSVLCLSTGNSCPAPAPAPAPVQPECPACVTPCPVLPRPGCNENACPAPCVEIKGNVCPPACCKPTKCVVKRRVSPCDSPCIRNYRHKKVYMIDELSLFCGPFIRIVETRCRPHSREIIWTVSKSFPFHTGLLPIPTILRNASLLHKALCEARDKFSVCGCVCLFIDHFNNIYIAVGDDYYQVMPTRPCGPCPPPFPWRGPRRFPFPDQFPFPGPFPGPFPDQFPCSPCGPRYAPVNCSPCALPVKCAPAKNECEKPCPPMFTFCKVSCEHMVQVRRRGLYAVIFSRNLDFY
ncbi:uncharacterized protein NEMAJ01_0123 [Nematocida major]|uniref:uncharacterized protein n=1 Tax=Nematocida major TaxID=1912982 RepID=UPI002007F649|nr:uncharacterized protein NEMAJ01_0123 [Nematocida major]KAH9385227.1 hypothetical protein NEMAJ01_0123 [Nematocida major]